MERQWASYIEQYEAPRRGSADFPFPGASNEEIPITAEHVEPVLAQFVQSIHATSNLWTAVDLSGEFTDKVDPITEFLTIIDRLYLKMRNVHRRLFPELITLGTGIYHPTWLFQRKKVRSYDDNGITVSNIVTVDQPVCRHIPLADFIWPANAWDLDPDAVVAPAAWCGHRFKLTVNQLRAMSKGQEPFLPNFDKQATEDILKRESQQEEIVEQKIRELDQYQPAVNKKIELWRIECRYDVDDDGIDEDLVVIWHQPTATVLQAVFNQWHHGKRLYELEQYIQTFSLLGKGIAAMDEYAQAASSRLLNAGINNALIANTRMYGVTEGISMASGEKIYPGKVWPLGQGEQIQEIRLGDVYPSIFEFLGQLREWAENRTSVNELRTGNITGLPSRTPATTVLSLLNEGNKKFDMILGNIRTSGLANIGKRTLQMIAQRHQSGDTKWATLAKRMMGDDAAAVIEVLDLPVTALEEGLGIEVTTTSSQVNKETEKQQLLGLIQIMATSYEGLVQIAQATGDQQLFQNTLMAAYTGGTELLKRLLEAHNIQNPERYLPQSGQGNGAAAPQLPQQQGFGQPQAGPAIAPQQTGSIFGL
jgi:hypothetical protein